MRKVLIADDDYVICELYAEALSREGCEVITTSDGAGLIEMIEQHRLNLVVLDIRLGKYNGLDLTRGLKKICPFGVDTFQNSLYFLKNQPFRLIFADENATRIAPERNRCFRILLCRNQLRR